MSEIPKGVTFRIKRLSGSVEINQRLREMGCGEGQQAKLLSRHAQVICQVRHTRLGLSLQVARLMWVEPLSAPPPERVRRPQPALATRNVLARIRNTLSQVSLLVTQ